MKKSDLERAMATRLKQVGAPEWETEYKFHPARRWRFDFAWPRHMLAVEINGGIWANGRHSRGSGLVGDYEKLNEAQLAGWCVLQFGPNEVRSGDAAAVVMRALNA